MIRWLYSLLFLLLLPVQLLRMLWRSRLEPAYRERLAERFGLFRAPGFSATHWIHAVSVGELVAAEALIEGLLEREGEKLVVTTTTPAASWLLRQRYGERVFHVYLPLDLPWAVSAFLRRVRPSRLLLIEKELWPNLLYLTGKSGCTIWVVNARLNEVSARRYRCLNALFRAPFAQLSRVLAQTTADACQWRTLVQPSVEIEVAGNMKFDPPPLQRASADAASFARACEAGRGRNLVIAASTHPGEEALILAQWQQLCAACEQPLLLLLAPRHPYRASEVEALAVDRGFRTQRRSREALPAPDCDVFILDTLGELRSLFECARVVFMGGSLVPLGGHNLLEPARAGVPVVSGPYLDGQPELRDSLVDAGAMLVCDSALALQDELVGLLGNAGRCAAMGSAGQQMFADRRGASQRILGLLGRVR